MELHSGTQELRNSGTKITIIPAIDLIDAKCVRLSQGDYNQKTVYNENPLEVAKMFEDAGITRLHLVDLDGAKAKHIVNYKVLETIASKTSLIIDFGGGLKSDEDLRIAFESGAQMVTGGSIAVKDRETFLHWIKNMTVIKHYCQQSTFIMESAKVIRKINEKMGKSVLISAKSAYRDWETDRKSTRLNSSHSGESRMPSSA